MAFLELTDRLPDDRESIVFNAIAVTLVEHGLTPSAIVARMTYAGAPGAMQAAVAAGMCGLGSVFVGSMETAARMLQEAAARAPTSRRSRGEMVADLRKRRRACRASAIISTSRSIRARRASSRSPQRTDSPAVYVELMQVIAAEAESALRKTLPVNATGAIGAIASELGFAWKIVRGIGVMARAIGLVGHIREEMRGRSRAKSSAVPRSPRCRTS